jgi:hypothetical protein
MEKNEEICQKISEIYPEIGQCGIDIDVTFDSVQKSYIVNLKKDNHRIRHFLEPEDAELCLIGKQCVSLGLEIAQFSNY